MPPTRRKPVLRRLTAALVPIAVLAAAWASPPAAAQDDAGAFSDDDGAYYEAFLDALDEAGILEGTECAAGRICPKEPIKRSTMAIWLGRTLTDAEPDPVSSTRFADVDAAHPHAAHIERFAELGITKGCATDPLRYCPDDHVTRGQMATFLVRAFDLPDADPAGFADTEGHFFEDQINALAAAGITKGCATDPLRYCPGKSVSRGQMATFIARAVDLVPEDPTPGFAINPAMEGGGIIAAGERFRCAITTDRAVQCWGDGSWGPGWIPEAPEGEFTAVSLGRDSACGIRADRTIQCWGRTTSWDNDAQESVEWDIPQGEFTAVSSDSDRSYCGIRADQTIQCWGNVNVEWDIPQGEFTAVSLGRDSACGIRADQTIQCWGNVNVEWDIPQGEFTAVSLGRDSACGIRADQTIQCWGETTSYSPSGSVEWDIPEGEFTAVSSGPAHACGIRTDQIIQCWGDTTGYGTAYGNPPVVEWHTPEGRFVAVAAASASEPADGGEPWPYACGIRIDGSATCWNA